VPECFKDDSAIQWKRVKFDRPLSPLSHNPIVTSSPVENKWLSSFSKVNNPRNLEMDVLSNKNKRAPNSGDSDEIWYIVTGTKSNLLQNHVSHFYLTRIMSLLYLMKLEMLIAHVLPSRC